MACASLPGSNIAPFKDVKVPVSNSAEFFQKSDPWIIMEKCWRILEDFGGFWRILEDFGGFLKDF